MWTIFKVFIEFVTILLLFYVFCSFCFFVFFFFCCEACGILALQAGIEPTPPALEGEVLTIGPPEKSQDLVLNSSLSVCICVLSLNQDEPEQRRDVKFEKVDAVLCPNSCDGRVDACS